jgi:Pyruvate/2-oxoacid:ferredoxin oxidoreductase gamma subunit
MVTKHSPVEFTEFNILIVGVGGQGVITLGNLFQDYASQDPHIGNIIATESRGVSQREGSIYALIRYSMLDESDSKLKSKKLLSTLISPTIPVGNIHLLIALEPLEFLRYLHFLSSTGTVIVNTRPILPKSILTNKKMEYPNIQNALNTLKNMMPLLRVVANDYTQKTLDEFHNATALNIIVAKESQAFYPHIFQSQLFTTLLATMQRKAQ